MLINLHVKNLALIEEAEVDFTDHLNILTGETGAGKSILIGSIQSALGGKIPKDMIREGADSALIELVFHTETQAVLQKLDELEIPSEDGEVVISRRVTNRRVINKINDITIHCTSQEDHDEVLKILRSANWIPCSERLPKPSEHTDNMVLVCMSDGKVRFGACWYNRGICEGWVGDLPVVAWRPLPEPWKGEER